jgi:hypothetical protein
MDYTCKVEVNRLGDDYECSVSGYTHFLPHIFQHKVKTIWSNPFSYFALLVRRMDDYNIHEENPDKFVILEFSNMPKITTTL